LYMVRFAIHPIWELNDYVNSTMAEVDYTRIFGVSFSVPYAQYLGLDPKACFDAALNDLGFRRFRLMSYWNRLEPEKDTYDFRELDWQINMAEKYGAEVTLCLGLRQPRWPESHWPDWALN